MLFMSLCILYLWAFGLATHFICKIPIVRKALNKLLQ